MALEDPSLTVDLTSTAGTGAYSLNDPAAPGGGLRTLADAVADGHVSDGDTVEYMVADTTTEGALLAFERGVGTVSDGGATVTRDDIRQSSNSDNKVNWAGGGSRTFRVALDPLGVGRLAAANTWAAAQTFDAAASFTGTASFTGASMSHKPATGAVGDLTLGRLANGILVDIHFEGRDSGANNTEYGLIRARAITSTDGSETGGIDFLLTVGGAIRQKVAQVRSGGLENGSGVPYDAFPSGTKMLFQQTAAPTGWTKDTTHNDAAVRVVSGTAGSGGSRALSSATVGATTLALSQIPSHTHGIKYDTFTVDGGAAFDVKQMFSAGGSTENAVTSSGSGNSHDHTLALKYLDVIVATKD